MNVYEFCSKCGEHEDYTIDAVVMVALGQEGEAQVEMRLCQEHAIELIDWAKAFGFVSHRHGGANLLEAACGSTCPTPTSSYCSVIVHPKIQKKIDDEHAAFIAGVKKLANDPDWSEYLRLKEKFEHA